MRIKFIYPAIIMLFASITAHAQGSDVYTVNVNSPGTFKAESVPEEVIRLKITGSLDLPNDCVELYRLLDGRYFEELDLKEASFLKYHEPVELPTSDYYSYYATCYSDNSFPVGLFFGLGFSGRLIMPASLKTVQPNTFYSDATFSQGAEVVFSEGVDSIGQDAFCFSRINKVTLPQSLKYLGSGCFYDNQYLEEIYLPDGLTVVDDSLLANCGRLTHVHLPASMKRMEWWSLSGTAEILTIPAGTEFVGYQSLDYCGRLKEIHCLASVPPECGHTCSPFFSFECPPGNTFNDNIKQNVVLYVPKGSVEAYRNAEEWGDFADIREETDGYEEDLSWYDGGTSGITQVRSDSAAGRGVYTLQGVCVKRDTADSRWKDGLPKGIYIVDGKKTAVR